MKKVHSLSERILSKMFWVDRAYYIANKSIYNKPGQTPLESVYSTNVYEVLKFISLDIAKDTLKAEHQEQAHDEAMKKQKRKR